MLVLRYKPDSFLKKSFIFIDTYTFLKFNHPINVFILTTDLPAKQLFKGLIPDGRLSDNFSTAVGLILPAGLQPLSDPLGSGSGLTVPSSGRTTCSTASTPVPDHEVVQIPVNLLQDGHQVVQDVFGAVHGQIHEIPETRDVQPDSGFTVTR